MIVRDKATKDIFKLLQRDGIVHLKRGSLANKLGKLLVKYEVNGTSNYRYYNYNEVKDAILSDPTYLKKNMKAKIKSVADDIERTMTLKEVLKRATLEGRTTSKLFALGKNIREHKVQSRSVKGVNEKYYNYDEVVRVLQSFKKFKRIVKKDNTNNNESNVDDYDIGTKTIETTKIMLQDYQARLVKNKVDIATGESVLRSEVETAAYIASRVIRTQILTLPERVAGEILAMESTHEIKEYLYREINIILNQLTDESLYKN